MTAKKLLYLLLLTFLTTFSFAQNTEGIETIKVKSENSGKTLFDIDLGYSYQIAESATEKGSAARKYENKLRSGFTYGTSLQFRLNHKSLYLGPMINIRHYSAKEDSYMINMSDFITMLYIAPKFTYTIKTKNNKGAWRFNGSLGYMNFWDKFKTNASDKKTFHGGTIGSALDVAYDVRLSESRWIAFKISALAGNVTKTKVGNEVVSEEKSSMNALNFTVGLRFGK